MRTTISLDDRLAEQVRRKAAEEGLSVSAYIAKVLRHTITQRSPTRSPPFRLVTVGGKGVRPGTDLDRPRSLDIEDDERVFAKKPSKA